MSLGVRALILLGVYSDIFIGNWHGEKVAVKGLRHIQATPSAQRVGRDTSTMPCLWQICRHSSEKSTYGHASDIPTCINLSSRALFFRSLSDRLPLYGLTSFPGRSTGKQLFMVSPWQDRGDMLSFCRSNPDADRLSLLEGAASAFAYLHAQHIVHGNVRSVSSLPSLLIGVPLTHCTKANILIDPNFRPLVCHFGLSKMVEEVTETTAQMTLTSEPNYSRFEETLFVCTISPSYYRYLAPELIKGDITSPKMSTDVYSFGMAILECLTLEKPFANRKRVRGLRRPRMVAHDIASRTR